MARHPWLEKSRNELLEMFAANALTPQSTDSVLIRTIIESRIAEEQLRAAARNAEAGDQLASLTKGSCGRNTTPRDCDVGTRRRDRRAGDYGSDFQGLVSQVRRR